ncbi:hypothetical protein A6301_07210 [Pectobacterium sp. IFB5596]|nr:hypothetical protein [Pectobacterium sp. IFB5596]
MDTPTGERWFYRYDLFGRRIGKRCDQSREDIRYLWDGDQIAEVRHHRDGELTSLCRRADFPLSDKLTEINM